MGLRLVASEGHRSDSWRGTIKRRNPKLEV